MRSRRPGRHCSGGLSPEPRRGTVAGELYQGHGKMRLDQLHTDSGDRGAAEPSRRVGRCDALPLQPRSLASSWVRFRLPVGSMHRRAHFTHCGSSSGRRIRCTAPDQSRRSFRPAESPSSGRRFADVTVDAELVDLSDMDTRCRGPGAGPGPQWGTVAPAYFSMKTYSTPAGAVTSTRGSTASPMNSTRTPPCCPRASSNAHTMSATRSELWPA